MGSNGPIEPTITRTRLYFWQKRHLFLKGCVPFKNNYRAFDSCQRRTPIYNFGERRQNNCQIKRQFEPQTPNEKKLRTSTRYEIIVQIKAIICP